MRVSIFEDVLFMLEDLPADRLAPRIGDGDTVRPSLGTHDSSVAGKVEDFLPSRYAVRKDAGRQSHAEPTLRRPRNTRHSDY